MTTQIAREETCCHHIGYSFRLAARVLLYASSHRQDRHSISSMGPPKENQTYDPLHHVWMLYDIHVCICVYICVYIYVCVCVCVCIYIYVYMCVCVCVYIYIYVYMCVCVCVCVYIY